MPAVPLRHWLQLSLTRGLGPILTRRLIAVAGSAEAACAAGGTLLREVDGVGKAKADTIAAGLREAARVVDDELEKVAHANASAVCPDDAGYPLLLRSIPDPPSVLYLRGAFEPRDLHAVAIVGSRKCSVYGREQAERFGALLAGAGVTVVSGGARGIDTSAHRGAMARPGGRTVAVLGTGVDVAYPPENAALFDRIAAAGGMVASEYPMGTRPAAENFPRRNRIISGLSRGVIVVEADERSGALITARQACDDHGRPVFAVPGRVDNPLSQGPHQLLRDGAVLCARIEDVLDNLGPLPDEAHWPLEDATSAAGVAPPVSDQTTDGPFAATRQAAPDAIVAIATSAPAASTAGSSVAPVIELPDRQQLIYDALGVDPSGIDAIIERTSLPAHIVLQELTFLTLRGIARRIDGQTFARRR